MYGVTIANVMFAYSEIKNQYTITYQERIFHSMCCKKVMDFLISGLLVTELDEEEGALGRRTERLGAVPALTVWDAAEPGVWKTYPSVFRNLVML